MDDDFYVTLQPLTLDLIATQFERVGWKYQQDETSVRADWDDYVVTVNVLPDDVFHIRVTLLKLHPASTVAALSGRCNWWNLTRLFLKASVTTVVGKTEDDQSYVFARICLDLDVPLASGVAPVQLQGLLREVLKNTEQFRQQAKLDTLFEQSAWE